MSAADNLLGMSLDGKWTVLRKNCAATQFWRNVLRAVRGR